MTGHWCRRRRVSNTQLGLHTRWKRVGEGGRGRVGRVIGAEGEGLAIHS